MKRDIIILHNTVSPTELATIDFENELNMNGITYHVAIKDIDQFENKNDIFVNVYGVEQRT